MGSLLDVARVRAAGKKRGAICSIAILRDRNPDKVKDIDELVEAAGPTAEVSYSVAAEILSEIFKLKMKGDVVSRHQRRVCACRS